MEKYLMGIDAGTGSVRVALYDIKGNNLAYQIEEYGTTFPRNGWAEQDDNEWWEALKKAIPGCIQKSGVNPEDIVAVTCDATTNTLVFLGEDGTSVRPRFSGWMSAPPERLLILTAFATIMRLPGFINPDSAPIR